MSTYIISFININSRVVSSATYDDCSFVEAQARFHRETNHENFVIGIIKINRDGTFTRAQNRHFI